MNEDPRTPAWRQLLRQLAATQDHEVSCSECFEQISDDADLELAGAPVAERLRLLRQRLGQCRVCREGYEVLHWQGPSAGPTFLSRPGAPNGSRPVLPMVHMPKANS